MIEDYVISADGVRRAASIIESKAVRTPLIESEYLNELTGGRILLKAEVLQHCGAFKFRGAYNLVSQLTPAQRERGILAWSSGNHAQGIARAAKIFDAPATIIMPEDTPKIKAEVVRRLGGKIISYDRYSEDREVIAYSILEETGMALAPSYDHPHIIEGQGTLALEAADDAKSRGLSMDAFIVPCGGGGMTAGCAVMLEETSPETDMWIAEPEGFADAWASIETGERQYADTSQKTICDAIATPTPGRLTLPILERRVRGGAALTEAEVIAAVLFAYKYLKLVVEPGGVVALASVLSGKFDARGKVVGVVLSGGNIDPVLFAQLIGGQN